MRIHRFSILLGSQPMPVFLKCRAAARYQTLASIITTLLVEDGIGLLLYAVCRNTILGAYNSDHLPEETFI